MAIYVKQKVKVEDVQHCGYYNGWKDGNSCSGNTVTVTLSKGRERARCEGILIWEDADDNVEFAWHEFKEFALAGEKGYSYWTED